MKSSRLLLSSCVAVLAIVVASPLVRAQSGSTSALAGTVSDPTGALIPGVTVMATAVATNQSRSAVSDESGVYRLSLLEPGAYRVRFSLPGFKTAEVSPVNLVVTETVVLNRTLEVGAQSEQVTVEATGEVLQTATAALGTKIHG